MDYRSASDDVEASVKILFSRCLIRAPRVVLQFSDGYNIAWAFLLSVTHAYRVEHQPDNFARIAVAYYPGTDQLTTLSLSPSGFGAPPPEPGIPASRKTSELLQRLVRCCLVMDFVRIIGFQSKSAKRQRVNPYFLIIGDPPK